jgi:hypothetical protein
MDTSTRTHPLSTFSPDIIEGVIGGSIFALRKRECQLFREDANSPVGLRLASIRGELQRILAGQRVRPEILARVVQPPPTDSAEGAECGLLTEPQGVEVATGG